MALNGLKSLISGLSELDLEQEQRNAIIMYEDDIVLAQAEVLSEGKDKTGMQRNDRYKPMTIEAKANLKGLAGVTSRVTFYMTGLLYGSLFTKINSKSFRVEASSKSYPTGETTSYTFDKMIKRIGEDRYGLDQQRINYIRQNKIIPMLRDKMYTKTGILIP